MNISDNIKAIRKEKGLTQTEVAKRYGTSPEFYHRLEKKGKSLTLEQVEKIANALEVPINELIEVGSSDASARIKVLERKNAEMKVLLEEEVKGAKEQIKEFEQRYQDLMKHMQLYEAMITQKRENDRKVKLFAKEVLTSTGETETQEKLIRFIRAFFLDDESEIFK